MKIERESITSVNDEARKKLSFINLDFTQLRKEPCSQMFQVFTYVPFLVQNASILPGLSNHDIVSVEILISPVRMKQPRIKIFF